MPGRNALSKSGPAGGAAGVDARFEPTLALEAQAGVVHLWLLEVGSEDLCAEAAWRGLLSADELARNEAFRDSGARRLHLAGRALLRATLSRYAPLPPGQWRFRANAHGRPVIDHDDVGWDLGFNLAHTDGLVALVVSSGSELGVDVETSDRQVEVDDLAPLVCAPEEAAALAEAPVELRNEMFLHLWTLKEAYLKARGVGLSGAMTSCVFDMGASAGHGDFAALRTEDGQGWRFAQRRPTPGHVLAIARRGRWGGLRVIETPPV